MRLRLSSVAIMLSMLFILTGCELLVIGTVVGAGGFKYHKDTVHTEVKDTVPQAHNAAIRTLEKFKIKILNQKFDEFSSNIHGEFADGDELMIDMKSKENKTHIKVRVGVLLGDRNRSEKIAQEIINNLQIINAS